MQSGMGADAITAGLNTGVDIGTKINAAYNTGQQQALTQEAARQKMEEYARDEKPIMLKDIAAQVPEHLQFGVAVLANQKGIVEGEKGKEFVRTGVAGKFFKEIENSVFYQEVLYRSGLKIVERQQDEIKREMEPYKIKVDGVMQNYDKEAEDAITEHTRERAKVKKVPDVNFINDTRRKAKEKQLKYQTSPEGAADIKAYEGLKQKSKQLDLTWTGTTETLGKARTYVKKLNERFGNDIGGMVAAGEMKFMDAIRLEEQAKYEGRVQAYEMERAWKEQEAAKDRAAGKYAKTGRTPASAANTNTYEVILPDDTKVLATKEAGGRFRDQTGKLIIKYKSASLMGKAGTKEKPKLELRGGAKAATPAAGAPTTTPTGNWWETK